MKGSVREWVGERAHHAVLWQMTHWQSVPVLPRRKLRFGSGLKRVFAV